jgi:DNA-binding CsgD family transcriptional regulator
MSIAAPEAENQVVPPAASSSWRTWLMTGTRQGPVYRRRVRGAHKGLKRMLVEGMGDGVEAQSNWRGFSGSMVRQAVGEAVSALPPRQRQLIKLAYFGDLTNREIAQGLGITLNSVERGRRQAIARVSEHVQRGRAAGRKAIFALATFLGGRWLSEAHQAAGAGGQQWVKAGTLLLATATAGAVLAAHPGSPAPPAQAGRATIPAVVSVPNDQVLQPHVGVIRRATETVTKPATVQPSSIAGVPVAPPPITLPVKVKDVQDPVTSLLHGLLGA